MPCQEQRVLDVRSRSYVAFGADEGVVTPAHGLGSAIGESVCDIFRLCIRISCVWILLPGCFSRYIPVSSTVVQDVPVTV
jgi:hypothetical protein